MSYYHGVKAGKKETSVSTPVVADSGIHFIVGTAPVHTVGGKTNEVILVNSYSEAVGKCGYSDDWEKYTICEEIYSAFKLYATSPIVIVNVLSTEKHLAGETEEEYEISANRTIDLPFEVLKDTLEIKSVGGGQSAEPYEAGIDYDSIYTDGVLRIEIIEGGNIPKTESQLSIKYNSLASEKVTKGDIIGGYDTNTKKKTGFELLDSVFPKYRIVPDLLLAPGFSQDSEVAAVMSAKAENINGLFIGKALIDADTTEIREYSEVPEWKNKNNIVQPSQLLLWPMVTLGGRKFHYSVHQAGLMSKTDNTGDLGGGSPCESASNKTLQIDGAVLADGTEVLLDLNEANYLNRNGIITVLNLVGGYVSWGNETACYPSNTDVTDYFYCVNRMFDWVANTTILSVWKKVDRKLNKRLIESVVQSLNQWLNGLFADEKILGGRIEFLEEENTITDLMAGKAKFHIYLTPPSPAKEFEFILEYDVSYIETLYA